MSDRPRVVVDTGVAVSAALMARSVPRQTLDLVLDRGGLLVSEALAAELANVFRRPKFDRYVTEEERLEFLASFLLEAEWVEVTESITDCRDPKDNMLLELAVSGWADYLVTGDRDLLVLHPFRGIVVLTPQDFVTEISDQSK